MSVRTTAHVNFRGNARRRCPLPVDIRPGPGSGHLRRHRGHGGLLEGRRARLRPHPLGPAAFAALYGMLTGRFGVTWIVGLTTGS